MACTLAGLQADVEADALAGALWPVNWMMHWLRLGLEGWPVHWLSGELRSLLYHEIEAAFAAKDGSHAGAQAGAQVVD